MLVQNLFTTLVKSNFIDKCQWCSSCLLFCPCVWCQWKIISCQVFLTLYSISTLLFVSIGLLLLCVYLLWQKMMEKSMTNFLCAFPRNELQPIYFKMKHLMTQFFVCFNRQLFYNSILLSMNPFYWLINENYPINHYLTKTNLTK
jgi:hypothetical protein